MIFKKFNLFKTGEWIMERQNEYKCAFSAFLKQAEEIPSIPTVPQAYGKYLTSNNKLKINKLKTKEIVFHRPRGPPPQKITPCSAS